MIKSKDIKNISSTLHRSIALMLLLCFVALGVKAQEVWWPRGTHATGIENGVVYLNDLENHNWTYYSGVDVGNYNTDYAGKLYSPYPRNVMITYQGRDPEDSKTSNVKVSIDNGEEQHTFVYYKTLEEGSTEGKYPYTVISNPFSVRPSVENADRTKTYYGFNGWKIIDGGEFIKGYDDEEVLPLDAEIMFENLPYDIEGYPVNCISANIVFQATWVPLNKIVHRNSTSTSTYTYPENIGGTYETNILVLQGDQNGSITVKSPCTIMMVEPDGSADYRAKTFSKLITPMAGGNTKIEFAHWQPSGAINARGRNFTIGRGMKMDGTIQALYGTNTESVNVDQMLKVESGKFTNFYHYGQVPQSITKQEIVYGCDYDRAQNDNNKLEFTQYMHVGTGIILPTNSTDEICRVYSLSGKFITGTQVANAAKAEIYYLRVRSEPNKGHSYLEILGGEWNSIAGGWGDEHEADKPAFTFRMKGGTVNGVVYGAGEYYNASGIRTFVITGGTIKGWVAGGANGTQSTNGKLDGESFIYVGGNTRVDSNPDSNASSNKIINRAVGGNVFGAGCGYSASSSSGQVTLGTNVVIADNAYVERGVYGGGSYGYCKTDQTSNIYITGGKVDGKAGGVNGTEYESEIQGGVYGGACQNKGGNVNIFMTGGTVNGGLYGGSNASGALSGNVNITIAGGSIGTQDKTASVYGGGYGSATTINGSTSITMTGGTINGNLFGGGNQGAVNSNTSVTITGGSVTGNVYGGGDKAEVKGKTNVVIGRSGN